MKQWVKSAVAEVASELAAQKDEVGAGFPLEVFAAVKEQRPDVIKHLRRYGSTDPYQYVAMYIPKVLYKTK